MKHPIRAFRPLIAVACSVLGASPAVDAAQSGGSPDLTPDQKQRIEQLIEQMTLEEKAGQMTQVTLGAVSSRQQTETERHELDVEKARRAIVDVGVGSILNGAEGAMDATYWREVIGSLQKMAVEDTRLGIPLIYGVDSVHGANYVNGGVIFPHNLTLAASFEPELARQAGEITAAETRAVGIPWNFAPVCDVGRAPAWSRIFETFGEDPYLCAVMSRAAIEGMQGTDLSGPTSVAATAKHFLAYGGAATGRDRTPTYVGDVQLYDIYVPPFRAAVEAGVRSVMVNSSEINGVPVHGSHRLLTELLRDELGFGGVIVTDWEDVYRLHTRHRIARDEREAVELAVKAGVDVSMVPYDTRFADHVVALVNDGRLSEARIDESVRRILELKAELGLFERTIPDASAMDAIGSQASRDASLEAARRSIVMLRNRDAVLPLANTAKVFVTGPAADDAVSLHGAWSYAWQGTEAGRYPESPTVLDAVREAFGSANVTFEPGVAYNRDTDIAAAVTKAEDSDAIVLCLGELPSTEKPGDIGDLTIGESQRRLAAAMAATGRPVILVLIENRPRIISAFADDMDAILWAGHPGPYGAQAIAEIMTGKTNPSGRLPMTYPRSTNELITYDHKHIEAIASNDAPTGGYNPLFPFFAGESFTTFEYDDLSISVPAVIEPGSSVDVTVTVTNTGDVAGAETVGVFVADHYASITPHVRRLRAFDKVALGPGESAEVSVSLDQDDFSLIGNAAKTIIEPGTFTVEVGPLKKDIELSK
ncbi:MAG: beta-glucosidase [Phycisphaerae bacterium]|nr:beta-glucosidase [Phycisphaerae bacterium]